MVAPRLMLKAAPTSRRPKRSLRSRTKYQYDGLQRLASADWRNSGGTSLYAYEYQYDKAGNRTSILANGEATYYSYNAANEVVYRETLGADQVYYTYDGRGNRVTKHTLSAHTQYFEYNSRNLLTAVTSTDPAFTPNYFEYNALGQRVKVSDSTGTRRLVWDGLNVTHEVDGAGTLDRRYTHGYSPMEGVCQILDVQDLGSPGDPHSFYHFNHPGGVTEMTDEAGNVTWNADYEPFGRVIAGDSVTVPRFTYPPTYEALPDLGILHSPTRPFDPEDGQYTVRDSMHSVPTYTGFAGNPLSVVDPSGQLQFEGCNTAGPIVGGDPKGEVPGVSIWWGIWAKLEEEDIRSLRESGGGFFLIERQQRGYAVDCRGELPPWTMGPEVYSFRYTIGDRGLLLDTSGAAIHRLGEGQNPGNIAYLKGCALGLAPWSAKTRDREPHPLHCTEGFIAVECRVTLYKGLPIKPKERKELDQLDLWLWQGRGERRAENYPPLRGFQKMGGETFTTIWRWNYCVTPGCQDVYGSPRLPKGPNRAGRPGPE